MTVEKVLLHDCTTYSATACSSCYMYSLTLIHACPIQVDGICMKVRSYTQTPVCTINNIAQKLMIIARKFHLYMQLATVAAF